MPYDDMTHVLYKLGDGRAKWLKPRKLCFVCPLACRCLCREPELFAKVVTHQRKSIDPYGIFAVVMAGSFVSLLRYDPSSVYGQRFCSTQGIMALSYKSRAIWLCCCQRSALVYEDAVRATPSATYFSCHCGHEMVERQPRTNN